MDKKERWYSSIILLVSVLPLIFIGAMQSIVDGPFIFIDEIKGVEYKFTQYQMNFIGLFCLVPALIVVAGRFIKNRGMLERHFYVMMTATLVLCVAYFVAVIIIAWRTISKLEIGDVVFKINYASLVCATLSIIFCIYSNVLPQLKPNPIFGVKNKYTMNNPKVWEKVNSVASTTAMYIFLVCTILCTYSSSVHAVFFLVGAILAHYGLTYLTSKLTYDAIVKEKKDEQNK